MGGRRHGQRSGRRKRDHQVVVPVTQRGVTRVSQFELRTRYPFGWFYSWTYVQGSHHHLRRARHPRHENPDVGGRARQRLALRGTRRRGFLRTAGVPAWGAPEAHGLESAGARRRSGGAQLFEFGRATEWLDWSLLDGLDTEARLSQLCLWVLESDAAQRPYGLRIPARNSRPRAARRIDSRA